MKFYISDLSVALLLLFYLPFVIWVVYRVSKHPKLRRVGRIFAIVLTLALAYVIPLGDVTMNSIAMAKLCRSAGLHVYKQVQVDGYYDPSTNGCFAETSLQVHRNR